MKLSEIMKDNTSISLATVESEGKPRIRMFSHQFIVDRKICFATSNQASAYADFAVNPYAEIMQFTRGMYVRASGEVVKAEGDERVTFLARVAEANPWLVEMKTKEVFDQTMEVFYLDTPKVTVVDYKTRQPIEVEIA